MKICIATPDILGPIRNGGVGTAFYGLAEALRDAGHSVSVFYTSDFYEHGDPESWRGAFAESGFEYIPLADTPETSARLQNLRGAEKYALRSYRIYEYLKTRTDFDIVHFPDYLGLGYYSLLARKSGIAFPDTRFAVTTHGPVAWSRAYSYGTFKDLMPVVVSMMEKLVIEAADLLLSPSQFLLDWIRDYGWSLPKNHVHAFNRLPAQPPGGKAETGPSRPVSGPGSLNEIVFFGRVEQRKGVYLFIDAINSILEADPAILRDIRVTFLGKLNEQNFSPKLLGRRVNHWPIEWESIDGFHAKEALAYLSQPGRLAVIPSLMDNSPCTIQECLERGIPFITTNVGGIPELLDPQVTLSEPNCASIAQALKSALANGHACYKPAAGLALAGEKLVEIHEQAGKRTRTKTVRKAARMASPPQVSVCLVHRNRPRYLAAALEGFAHQTYTSFEVIVADNGSSQPDALEFLDRIERGNGFDFPLHVLRMGSNAFPAPARNAAAAVAQGRILKFHDDDNISKPEELATLVRAIESGFELVTCALDIFYDDDDPGESSDRLIFLGDGGALSMMYNVLGDANFAILKDRFEEIGGFDDKGFLYHAEDWLFLAKAQARGLKLTTVPEALIWYRSQRNRNRTNWRKGDVEGARFRACDVLTQGYPEPIRNMMKYIAGTC